MSNRADVLLSLQERAENARSIMIGGRALLEDVLADIRHSRMLTGCFH